MVLYALRNGKFISIKNMEKNPDGSFEDTIYVNMTNKCPCSCTFCLRQTKKMMKDNTLWLTKAPEAMEVTDELDSYNLSETRQIVFCGFGEPMERLDEVLTVADHIKKKYPHIKVRMNTNGLGNLIWGKDVTPLLKGRLDAISISLNTSSAEKYEEITKSRFGLPSFQALQDFAVACKKYIPDVTMTVVDVIGKDEIEKCRKIAAQLGVKFRVRVYEAD